MNKKTTIIFIIYIILLTWLVLFKLTFNLGEISHIRSINLIPFSSSAIVNGNINIYEIIYNVLIFIPLGVYISIIKNKWSIIQKIITGVSISLIFEIIQYTFYIGCSDITDVITNSIGTLIGISTYSLLNKCFNNKAIKVINIIGGLIEIIAIALIILITLANL